MMSRALFHFTPAILYCAGCAWLSVCVQLFAGAVRA